MKVSKTIYLVFIAFLFFSCASNPGLRENGYFSGYVIDENNKPVSNYIVNFSDRKVQSGYAITNENGFFYLRNVYPGEVKIYAKNPEWSGFEDSVQFMNKNQVFCFQVFSADYVLDRICECGKIGDYDKAIKMLNKISYEKKTALEDVVLFYKKKFKEKKREGLREKNEKK